MERTRIGCLAYLEDQPGYRLYLRAFARGDAAGCAQLTRADVAEDMGRPRSLVDVLVVGVQWGESYADVTPDQERTGRWIAGLGGRRRRGPPSARTTRVGFPR